MVNSSTVKLKPYIWTVLIITAYNQESYPVRTCREFIFLTLRRRTYSQTKPSDKFL
jgi:hypothetical protein